MCYSMPRRYIARGLCANTKQRSGGTLRRAGIRQARVCREREREAAVRLTFASHSAGGCQLRGRTARPHRPPHDRYLPPPPPATCPTTSHHFHLPPPPHTSHIVPL
ncbi:hypothetical protein RR48_11631 [Papilio machaon]|uniref:Uncharacterized protein n=1 Tax=Papilio machaon TaxID=76193 RepID=A0A194R558_PAPMA|nr:hypothetical protein RR48_11631 [Papilio machaon]